MWVVYVLRHSPIKYWNTSNGASTILTMSDFYHPSYDSRYPHHQYPPMPSATSSNSSDENNDPPPTPPKSADLQQPKSEAKPQATFLTKLYAYVRSTVLLILFYNPSQSSWASWKPPYDSVGPCRRTYHRRETRAACSSCPSKYIPSVSIC